MPAILPSSGLAESRLDVVPVRNIPPSVNVLSSVIEIVKIVAMFPDIQRQEQRQIRGMHEILFLNLVDQ